MHRVWRMSSHLCQLCPLERWGGGGELKKRIEETFDRVNLSQNPTVFERLWWMARATYIWIEERQKGMEMYIVGDLLFLLLWDFPWISGFLGFRAALLRLILYLHVSGKRVFKAGGNFSNWNMIIRFIWLPCKIFALGTLNLKKWNCTV